MATTTPTAFWFRNCLITLSNDFCIGSVIACISCFTAPFSITFAYDDVVSSSRKAKTAGGVADGLGSPADVPPIGLPLLSGDAAILADIFLFALPTASQTLLWSASAIALKRTLGWAITDACVSNLPLVPTQRPCSTQNTARSTGSLSAGTILSLPPVTTSPASRISGRFELLTSTS